MEDMVETTDYIPKVEIFPHPRSSRLIHTQHTYLKLPSLSKPFVRKASPLRPHIFSSGEEKKFINSRLEIKMPVTTSFTPVYHTTSPTIATAERKEACSSLSRENGRTILIIDLIDSCTLGRCDNRYST